MTIFTAKNILDAYKLARKSRKSKQEVYMFDQNLETRLILMLNELKNKKYAHDKYKQIILYDSKKRYIYSPGFRDHIFHHLVYKQIYETLDKKMVDSTFACRKGYGGHRAILYLNEIIRKEERRLKKSSFSNEKLYYLKIDFSKYFFSINHEKLKEKIRKYIKDEEILYCIDLIVDGYKSPKIYDKLLKENIFYTDELNKGLPIGGIVSQLFANFYLNDFDQFLKHKLKVRFIRYMDDVLILGNKQNLNEVKKEVFKFIIDEKLILNPKKTSFNLVSDGVTFVGYKIINNKVFVGKRIKKSFLKFSDSLLELEKKKLKLTKEDIHRIQCMYYSRTGCFKIADFGEKFINKRENIDFLRGANGNNGTNSGIFTMNLNWDATNQNNNVGFRCSSNL